MTSKQTLERALLKKLNKLLALEKQRFGANSGSNNENKSTDALAEKVVYNCQLKILDFHARYESPTDQ